MGGLTSLAINAFIEAIFFPIPPDVLLIALCVAEPERVSTYALVATVFSSLGGVCGYFVGYLGGRPLAEKFFGKEKVRKAHDLYQKYEELVVFTAGFTPLPYKVFAITAGVCFVSLWKFFVFSVAGRGLRFFLEAYLIKLFAIENPVKLVNAFSLVVLGVILVAGLVYWKKSRQL
jgi:membrane protein YqaA with SNARE-associated domain